MGDLSVLNVARQKFMSGDERLAQSYYERAIDEGVPQSMVLMRKITREYLVFPLDFVDAKEYFELLFKLKELSNDSAYKEEYITALNSLINIKRLFLREVSLYYFSELALCYKNSLLVKHIYELYEYIEAHLSNIVDEDCYEIRYNIPDSDLNKLKIDMLQIKAFCLNILLSYSAAQDSAYTGKTYHATTYDYGWYASTNITSTDNYINWAIIKPRLNMIGLDAYYDEYLRIYKNTIAEIRQYCSFSSPKALQEEITKYIKRKHKKQQSDKDFNNLLKRFEKEDYSRKSFLKSSFDLAKFMNPILFLYRPFYEKVFGMDEVGSFELDTYFTRKKIWGVCDMISCGSHWSIEITRIFMLLGLCVGVGGLIYLGLGIAMKCGFYLPSVTIEKH